MDNQHVVDVASLQIQLRELYSQFDKKIKQGENFEEVKKLYLEIKELDSRLKVLRWRGDSVTA